MSWPMVAANQSNASGPAASDAVLSQAAVATLSRRPAPSAAAKTSGSDRAPAGPPLQEWTAGQKGPWGQIESIPFALDLPSNVGLAPPAPPVRWSFPGHSKEQVLAALRSAGIAEDEVEKLDSGATWSSDSGVTSVEPGDSLILSLTPDVRSKLYATLVAFPQNAPCIQPVWFRAGDLDWQLQDSRLAPESVGLLKRLIYPQGKYSQVFADSGLALRHLPNDAERNRFMQAVLRKRTVLARVRLDPDTDLEKLSQYWGIGGRCKDIYPFLAAVRRAKEDAAINVIYLLPNFAREHLYCYPCAVAGNQGVAQDCFWSAYNFFNDPPDNSPEVSHSHPGLNKNCYQIWSPNQLGDLMILSAPDGSVVHAAVFLADDLYFTKNGLDRTQPWILMHAADLLAEYETMYPGGLGVHYFRRGGL